MTGQELYEQWATFYNVSTASHVGEAPPIWDTIPFESRVAWSRLAMQVSGEGAST